MPLLAPRPTSTAAPTDPVAADPVPAAAYDLARRGLLPRHLAVIMDGNGRWAQTRGLARNHGHRAGAEAVRRVTRMARKLGIEVLTLYAFSEQNWSRPASEVQGLLTLLVEFLRQELDELRTNDIRLVAVGNLARLPLPVRLTLQHAIDSTARGRSMTLALCLSYGGREDLVQAARTLASRVAAGELAASDITEGALGQALWTAQLPCAPDLVVRTSGEQRLSNFLLWESAYAELYFSPAAWPEFDEQQLTAALQAFSQRQRRFGGVAAP
ncbi:MAG: di-trans,poly-cis-decaprenylcistransferase [Deltaproteobacteria bacterium]|nr:di-trans,poly-cis-decaprenylcistransferase [Deltaproteobacteria bacterium]